MTTASSDIIRGTADMLILKLLEIEPNFTVKSHGESYPFASDYDRLHYMEGLRLAGVPEG